MREVTEFRVDEQLASILFAESEGKRLGESVRKVKLYTTDPRYKLVGELQKNFRQSAGKPFFFGWSIFYKYRPIEINEAPLLRLKITSIFEPAGEECGTTYDELSACPYCGSGAKQTTPLILDLKRIPKLKDISKTISGEIVVSRRLVDLFASNGVTGIEFSPVYSNPRSGKKSNDWFQLIVLNESAEIVSPTRVGIDPFDDQKNGECRCPIGDLLGLNLLSEVSIKLMSRGNEDIICSQQFIGARRGLLRPERIIFISPKVWRLIESEKLKGFKVEVAYLV